MGIVFAVKNLASTQPAVKSYKKGKILTPGASSGKIIKPLTLRNKIFLKSLPGFILTNN